MSKHREGGSPDVEDRGPTRWEKLGEYVGEQPMIFWPLIVIMCVAVSRFFVHDDLANSLLSMVTITAFGTQWIGIVRYRAEANKRHWEFDQEQLAKIADLNKLSAGLDIGPSVKFLTPYEPSGMKRHWYKFKKKHLLSLYTLSGRSNSFTKFVVSEKDWFFLQLNGWIETSDNEVLAEALEYLKDHDKVATIL